MGNACSMTADPEQYTGHVMLEQLSSVTSTIVLTDKLV
jgi:hypothetical protein